MNIELEEGGVPVRSGVRPLNPDQRDNLKEQIDDWLAQGVIEPCSSPWLSPLVPVKKKDGRTRWVTYLRALNRVAKKDAYPLPSITENLERFKGAKVISSLDAAGAYHAVTIKEECHDYTAFVSPLGTFRFIRMPLRLRNAGSVYSQMIHLALSWVDPDNWMGYLDDVLGNTLNS